MKIFQKTAMIILLIVVLLIVVPIGMKNNCYIRKSVNVCMDGDGDIIFNEKIYYLTKNNNLNNQCVELNIKSGDKLTYRSLTSTKGVVYDKKNKVLKELHFDFPKANYNCVIKNCNFECSLYKIFG